MKRLFEPASPNISLLFASLVLIIVPLLAAATHATSGGFRIDEAHKLSESAFFPLWLRLDVRNQAWTADIIDRSNPPVGKYLLGLAIVIAGHRVPPLPTLSGHTDETGLVPPLFSDELSRPYAPFLTAGRWLGVVCTTLVMAIVGWCAARVAGVVAALAAIALMATQFLTRVYGASAIFDPILTLFATLLLLMGALAAGACTRRRFVLLMTAAGVAGALAFQTRLNGLLFFAVTLLLALAVPRAISEKSLGLIAATSAFIAVTLAVNPYYWPNPIARFAAQVRDLQVLLLRCGQRLTTPGLKLRFAAEALCGDLAGMILVLISVAGVATLVFLWRKLANRDRVIGLWSVITIVTFIFWMPVPYERYLLVAIPPLCCLAALAFRGATALVEAAE